MTRIDCRSATCKGLSPDEYIGGFIRRRGNDSILLEMDEEGNNMIILDPISAEFLAQRLLAMVGDIRKRFGGRTQTAPSYGQEEAVHKEEPTRR
jgi:hypothetical protein